MRTYRDLIVWKQADAVVLAVYEFTSRFPTEEKFGLTAQMRRAAVSIASNIAEGAGRVSRRDGARMLSMAAGSAWELGYQVDLSKRLGYVGQTADEVIQQIEQIKKMLRSLTATWHRQDSS